MIATWGTEHQQAAVRRAASSKLYKTKLCRHWERFGSCIAGTACGFAHGKDELREVPREFRHQEFCREASPAPVPAAAPPPEPQPLSSCWASRAAGRPVSANSAAVAPPTATGSSPGQDIALSTGYGQESEADEEERFRLEFFRQRREQARVIRGERERLHVIERNWSLPHETEQERHEASPPESRLPLYSLF